MRKLIAGPLQKSAISTVIIIDALDECKDEETTSAILPVLGRLISEVSKVKFFLTARPDPRVQAGFDLPFLKKLTEVFVLHGVELGIVTDDIRRFLNHRFLEIADRRGDANGWPSDEEIEGICERAAGSFANAAAILQSYALTSEAREPGPQDQPVGNPQIIEPKPQTSVNKREPLIPAWKRLISGPLPTEERISLIAAIFSDSIEVDTVNHLRGDDAQTLVDVIDEVLSPSLTSEELQKKCLGTLRKICGRSGLLPRSVKIPLCYDRLDTPLYRGGYSDVWEGRHQGYHVAVKVLRVYASSNFEQITRVSLHSLSKCQLILTVVEVLQRSCDLEDPSSPKRATAVGSDHGQSSFCDGFGVDGSWEHQ